MLCATLFLLRLQLPQQSAPPPLLLPHTTLPPLSICTTDSVLQPVCLHDPLAGGGVGGGDPAQ